MRFLRQSLTGLLLLSLTLGLLSFAALTIVQSLSERAAIQVKDPPQRERVFAVNVVTAKLKTHTPILTAYGEIESDRSLDVRARTSGTLVAISDSLENGARVTAGAFLAQIDPSDAQFALKRSKADLADAQAEVGEAQRGLILASDELAAARQQSELRKRALTRQRDLETRGVGSSAAVEMAELEAFQADQSVLSRRQAELAAEARVDQAKTQLTRAEIATEEAEKRLNDTRIVAEFDGVLDDVTVVQGRFVAANEQLAKLVDDTVLDVAFRLSTVQYARLLKQDGAISSAPVTARLQAFGLDLEASGRITRASASVGEGETGRKLYARLDAATGLKPGDFVTIEVTEPELSGVALLPASTLGGDGTVLVVTSADRLALLPVTLHRRHQDTILVSGEELDGARVVVNRTPVLGPGVRVRPQLMETGEIRSETKMMPLDPTLRERLITHVRQSADIADQVKKELVNQLGRTEVPIRTVERLQERIGG